MFKRTAGVSYSLKESIDGLEIIICGKMFHCTIVCGKNDHLYVSFCVVICLLVQTFVMLPVQHDPQVKCDTHALCVL
jgi:hypothetical protein